MFGIGKKPRKMTDEEMTELKRRAYEVPAIQRNKPGAWIRIASTPHWVDGKPKEKKKCTQS